MQFHPESIIASEEGHAAPAQFPRARGRGARRRHDRRDRPISRRCSAAGAVAAGQHSVTEAEAAAGLRRHDVGERHALADGGRSSWGCGCGARRSRRSPAPPAPCAPRRSPSRRRPARSIPARHRRRRLRQLQHLDRDRAGGGGRRRSRGEARQPQPELALGLVPTCSSGAGRQYRRRRHALVRRALWEAGIGFLMAPRYHSAMRHVGPTRVELGTRTFFTLLGPLSNPAGAKRQLIGVFAPQVGRAPLAEGAGPAREPSAPGSSMARGSDELDDDRDDPGGRAPRTARCGPSRSRPRRPGCRGPGSRRMICKGGDPAEKLPPCSAASSPASAGRCATSCCSTSRRRAGCSSPGRSPTRSPGRRRRRRRRSRSSARAAAALERARRHLPTASRPPSQRSSAPPPAAQRFGVSDILARICADKRREVASGQGECVPWPRSSRLASAAAPPRGFLRALERAVARSQGFGLIAEIKRASPSRGLIRADSRPGGARRGLCAGAPPRLSVLTDAPYFEGQARIHLGGGAAGGIRPAGPARGLHARPLPDRRGAGDGRRLHPPHHGGAGRRRGAASGEPGAGARHGCPGRGA